MPHRITVNLTLLAMLCHGALGCSWHHAHAADGSWSCAAPAECRGGNCEAELERHNHSHDAAPGAEPEAHDVALETGAPGEPCQHTPSSCTEGECTYVRASDGEQLSFAPDLQGEVIGEAPGDYDAATSDSTRWNSEAALTASPYLPRCETKQLWLI